MFNLGKLDSTTNLTMNHRSLWVAIQLVQASVENSS